MQKTTGAGVIAFLVSVFLGGLFGCSSSTPTASFDRVARARVEGFALEGSPVVLVHDPAAAPPGDVPVAGAEVLVVDVEGEVVGMTQTAADGRFSLDDLPGGYLRVEVRKDPAAADPDALAELTGIPGTVVLLNRPYAVTRATAVVSVLALVPDNARVVASLQPAPAGTRVRPLGGDPGSVDPVPSVERVLPADEYVFFVDFHPFADYSHAVEYVFVDAETGAVTRLGGVFWPPEVNGEGIWQLDRALYHIQGVAWDDLDLDDVPADVALTASSEVVQEVPEPEAEALQPRTFARLQNHNTDPKSIFAIIWQASPELYKATDASRMVDLLANAGVPFESNIRLIRSHREGNVAIEDSEYAAALAELNQLIDARLAAGQHSTLVVYVTSHAGGPAFERYHNKRKTSSSSVFPEQLMLTTTKACRVRVFLEFCFARHFADNLAALFDALPQEERHDYVIYSASDRDELSYGVPLILHVATLESATPGGRFTTNLLDFADVRNGDITGLLNPPETEIRDELDLLFGTINVFENVFQRPSAIVRPNLPGFCIGSDVGTPLDLMRTLIDDARTVAEETFTTIETRLGEKVETLIEGTQQLREFLEGAFRSDAVGEATNHSSPPLGALIAALAHTEITGSIVFRGAFLAAQLFDAFGNTDFPEGPGEFGFTVAASMPSGQAEGDYLVALLKVDGDIPLADPQRFYQYGFVFDADGDPANNFVPVAGFENDFFGGTDRWYALEYAPAGGWKLVVTDARNNQFTEIASAARAIIRDDVILLLVPLSEFVDKTPRYRMTAFCHTGDFGLNPPHDWSGDLMPPIDKELLEVD